MDAALIDNIIYGLGIALRPYNLFYCFFGVLAGTILGVLPGIGVLVSISLLFPITFHLEPTAAIVMLAGIFYGTTYGGSTASILLNVPGTPANAVACLDGNPMARQGRAGVALLVTTVASFLGGSIGILLLIFFAPIIADNALNFRAQEYFSLMLLGLVAASTITTGSAIKGFAMVLLGLLVGLIGRDVNSGINRFTFGSLNLTDGISLVVFAMGIFGLGEILYSLGGAGVRPTPSGKLTFRSMLPRADEVRRSLMPMVRGAGIGSFLGTLPGTGGLIASYMSYAVEKKIAQDPSRFGTGAIEGLAGPETANNAADQTAFIPTLTLGIPGNATMAIMLGVLIVHGITPGPLLITNEPELFWGVVMSFWIGNLLLLLLNIPFIGLWIKLLAIPYRLLFPMVIGFICIGVYTTAREPFDVYLVAAFGAVGYILRALDFPMAPLILGFVLGPMMEEYFRRSLLLSNGDFSTFVSRPLSASFLALAAVLVVWAIYAAIFMGHGRRTEFVSNE